MRNEIHLIKNINKQINKQKLFLKFRKQIG